MQPLRHLKNKNKKKQIGSPNSAPMAVIILPLGELAVMDYLQIVILLFHDVFQGRLFFLSAHRCILLKEKDFHFLRLAFKI